MDLNYLNERTGLQAYFRDIGKIPLLTKEEEVSLARRVANGDTGAYKRFAESNLRFVVSIAKTYRTSGRRMSLELGDLIAEGNVGLIKAVRHFDPDRGVRFISYAVWWIRQGITEALEKDRMIHIPSNVLEDFGKYMRTESKLRQRLGREPSTNELAKAHGVDLSKAEFFSSIYEHPLPMDAPRESEEGAEENILQHSLASEEPLPDQLVAQSELVGIVDKAFAQLQPRDAKILDMRYGRNGYKPHTLQQTGEKMKLSRERIRQRENKALVLFRRK